MYSILFYISSLKLKVEVALIEAWISGNLILVFALINLMCVVSLFVLKIYTDNHSF